MPFDGGDPRGDLACIGINKTDLLKSCDINGLSARPSGSLWITLRRE